MISFLVQLENIEKLIANFSHAFTEDPRIILRKDEGKVRDIETAIGNVSNDIYLLSLKIERLKLEE